MALKKEERERLQAAGLPSDDEIRELLNRFLIVSGYTHQDMAEALGYSRVTVNHYLCARYGEHVNSKDNTLALRARIKEFIESHASFQQAMEFGPLFKTGDYATIRKAIQHAVNDGWAYCVDGPPGTRKSYLAKKIIQEIMESEAAKNGSGRRVYFVRARPNIKPQIVLQLMAQAAGVPSRGTIDQIIRKLRLHHAQRRSAFVFDEAQHFPTVTLETLRELLDEAPFFGLVFMGSHGIQQKFSELTMTQWHSRIEKTITLTGLALSDAERMVADVIGKIPAKAQQFLIANSYEEDVRYPKGHPQRRYLSARKLFNSMRQHLAPKEETA